MAVTSSAPAASWAASAAPTPSPLAAFRTVENMIDAPKKTTSVHNRVLRSTPGQISRVAGPGRLVRRPASLDCLERATGTRRRPRRARDRVLGNSRAPGRGVALDRGVLPLPLRAAAARALRLAGAPALRPARSSPPAP